MRWIVIVGALAVLGACGGTKIPTHSGYKNEKQKPWKKAKTLKLDDKGESKSEGDLNYSDFRRVRWYNLAVPAHGTLTVKVEITPPGDGASEDFDLGVEILDPGFRVISKSDLEDGDAGELTKTKTLLDLDPGQYHIHLYLQGRLDTADYIMRVQFQATKAPGAPSDFPAQVAYVPQLPQVPITDDCTGTLCKKTAPPPPPPRGPRGPRQPPPPKTDPKPPATVLTGRIIGVSVVGKTTRITIGRGTATGAQNGMKAKLNGISQTPPIVCNENTCAAAFDATPDQIRAAGGSATLLP